MRKLSFAGIIIIVSFLFSCREGIVEYPEIEKDNGAIYLDSSPRGALIFVKDTRTELKTPEEFQDLQPGEYVFTLKLDGYNDTTIIATVESGKDRFFSINLKLKE